MAEIAEFNPSDGETEKFQFQESNTDKLSFRNNSGLNLNDLCLFTWDIETWNKIALGCKDLKLPASIVALDILNRYLPFLNIYKVVANYYCINPMLKVIIISLEPEEGYKKQIIHLESTILPNLTAYRGTETEIDLLNTIENFEDLIAAEIEKFLIILEEACSAGFSLSPNFDPADHFQLRPESQVQHILSFQHVIMG